MTLWKRNAKDKKIALFRKFSKKERIQVQQQSGLFSDIFFFPAHDSLQGQCENTQGFQKILALRDLRPFNISSKELYKKENKNKATKPLSKLK